MDMFSFMVPGILPIQVELCRWAKLTLKDNVAATAPTKAQANPVSG